MQETFLMPPWRVEEVSAGHRERSDLDEFWQRSLVALLHTRVSVLDVRP